MPVVKFLGRVLPGGLQVSFDSIPAVSWVAQEFNAKWDFRIGIVTSAIEVEIGLDQFQDQMLIHLYMRSYDLVRACTDIASFATGYSLTAYLEKFVGPDGAERDLLFRDPSLPPLSTSFPFPPRTPEEREEFEKVLSLVMSEPPLFMALNDLIQAITLPHHAPVNCGRAIEGIRVLLTPTGADRKQGWAIMRENLRVDAAYLTFITDHSMAARHGDRAHKSGAVTTEIVRRSWSLMNRYLEFKKGGNRPLPPDRFPILIG